MPETNCVVPGCRNNGNHILPVNELRREKWIQAIRRGKNGPGTSKFEKWSPPSKYCYLCRDHFTDDDYITITFHGTAAERRTLKKTAVPSRFSWSIKNMEECHRKRRSRYEERSNKRRKLLDDITNNVTDDGDFYIDDVSSCAEIIVDETCDDKPLTNYYGCAKEFVSVPTQTPKQRMYSIENFRKDSAGVHFYTGLENIFKFYFVLHTLGPGAYCLNYIYHNVVTIDIPDQFFLVLMKLRRHTTNFELSRMFGVSELVVINVVITWINFMALQWKEVNIWPSLQLVQLFTPSGFKRYFPRTRIIVDGTECPIRKPKNPRSQQKTFSTYKNRNTVKVLVGASPGGLVSFVSDAYGGSASDRQITERSSLLHLCEPKDSIMADKGFNVQDLFAPCDVSINIPTFFKKKNRMNGNTVLRDRRISSKRVHIERIIGLAKTMKILVEPMTATETKLSSEIIFICFMVCNFRVCIIPKHA